MRLLQFAAIAIGLLVVRSDCVQAQDYWYDSGCYAVQTMYYAPYVAVYESWPVEAYYPPIAPQPWYGSTTAAEQSRMLAEPRSADTQAQRTSPQQQTYQRPVGAEGSAGGGTTITVEAYDNYFQPTTLNIQPGTTVRWVNRGRHTHTVTSNDRRWDSGDIKPGATWSGTFRHPGTYNYYCLHHTGEKMQGTIVVGGGEPAQGGSGATGY